MRKSCFCNFLYLFKKITTDKREVIKLNFGKSDFYEILKFARIFTPQNKN